MTKVYGSIGQIHIQVDHKSYNRGMDIVEKIREAYKYSQPKEIENIKFWQYTAEPESYNHFRKERRSFLEFTLNIRERVHGDDNEKTFFKVGDKYRHLNVHGHDFEKVFDVFRGFKLNEISFVQYDLEPQLQVKFVREVKA